MIHLYFNIFFGIILIILLVSCYIVYKKKRKNVESLNNVLNKNIELLNYFERKHELRELKNSIQLYSLFQIVLKITKADYVSFFKYDYSKKFLPINFILTINSEGKAVQKSLLDNIPAASNLLTLDIIKCDDKDLYPKYVDDIKSQTDYIYDAYCAKDLKKLYYQNIFKDSDKPIGFIIFSYKDKDFILSEDDKKDTMTVIDDMKQYI
jgi:hypothetical protein